MLSLSTMSERTGLIFFSGLLRFMHLLGPLAASNFGGWVMRMAGPFLKEHAVARRNLSAAFPEKSEDEVDRVLDQAWDNLGRIGAEYAFLDKLWDVRPGHLIGTRAEMSPEVDRRLNAIRESNTPALFFTAHLANLEVCLVAAGRHGLDLNILFRTPNYPSIAKIVADARRLNKGTMVAARKMVSAKFAAILQQGGSVAMFLDQHLREGIEGTFFGRPCRTNGALARLARQLECPIYGMYTVRLPDYRFRFETTEAITPVRDAEGKIDVAKTTQVINNVIESWVRQHPEQWLWQHRRWR